jgi:hypothetical protein
MMGLIVGALATWCVAAFLYYHKAFQWLRDRAQVYALREDGQPITWLGRQLACFWCVAFWVGLILWPLALTGAAMLLAGGGRIIWRAMENG